jgi:phage protein D
MSGSDRSGPGVRVTLLADEHATDGVVIDLSGRLISFAYEDTAEAADTTTFVVDNFDLALFDRGDLVPGAVLQVTWGYPGRAARPRRVVIDKLKGFAQLTIEAQAVSALLNREPRTRAWQAVRLSDIAREIAGERGYVGALVDVAETSDRVDTVNQAGETDAQLLRRLGEPLGHVFWIDDAGFHWVPRDRALAPSRVLTWMSDPGAGDILNIAMESDLTAQVGRVEVRGRDPLTRTEIEAVATAESVERTTLGEVIEVVDPETGTTSIQRRNATRAVHSSEATSQAEAQREADARFREQERNAVRLQLQIVGEPLLAARSIVEVRNVSRLLSGNYYVSAVKHLVSGSGYTCDLALTRDAFGRRAQEALDDRVREQGGTRNREEAVTDEGELVPVEVVDPEDGTTHVEYRRRAPARPANPPPPPPDEDVFGDEP